MGSFLSNAVFLVLLKMVLFFNLNFQFSLLDYRCTVDVLCDLLRFFVDSLGFSMEILFANRDPFLSSFPGLLTTFFLLHYTKMGLQYDVK